MEKLQAISNRVVTAVEQFIAGNIDPIILVFLGIILTIILKYTWKVVVDFLRFVFGTFVPKWKTAQKRKNIALIWLMYKNDNAIGLYKFHVFIASVLLIFLSIMLTTSDLKKILRNYIDYTPTMPIVISDGINDLMSGITIFYIIATLYYTGRHSYLIRQAFYCRLGWVRGRNIRKKKSIFHFMGNFD